MNVLKTLAIAGILVSAISISACQRKDTPVSKADKQVTVIEKKAEKLSLDSLDKRVTKLENRLDAAKAARAKAKAAVQ